MPRIVDLESGLAFDPSSQVSNRFGTRSLALRPRTHAQVAAVGIAAELAKNIVNQVMRSSSKRKRSSKNKSRSKRRKKSGGSKYSARSGRVVSATKRRTSGKRKVSLKSRVKALERKQCYAKKIIRVRQFGQLAHSQNACAYGTKTIWRKDIVEPWCTSLKYFDRAATPIQDSVTTVNDSSRQKFKFTNLYFKQTAKNGGKIPIRVTLYLLKVKQHTSTSPTAAIQSDDSYVGISDGTIDSLAYPSDYALFNQYFDVVKTCKALLLGGDELQMVHTIKSKQYDPTIYDQTTSDYNEGDLIFYQRIEGVLAHDRTTTSQVGTGDGFVDMMYDTRCNLIHPSDYNVKYIDTSQEGTTMTDTPETVGPNVTDQVDG